MECLSPQKSLAAEIQLDSEIFYDFELSCIYIAQMVSTKPFSLKIKITLDLPEAATSFQWTIPHLNSFKYSETDTNINWIFVNGIDLISSKSTVNLLHAFFTYSE